MTDQLPSPRTGCWVVAVMIFIAPGALIATVVWPDQSADEFGYRMVVISSICLVVVLFGVAIWLARRLR